MAILKDHFSYLSRLAISSVIGYGLFKIRNKLHFGCIIFADYTSKKVELGLFSKKTISPEFRFHEIA